MYQFFARLHRKKEWSFMNYGYAPLESEDATPSLSQEDEPNRYSIQLYHHLASAVNLQSLRVLEVGSGRGGGAHYLKRYFSPQTMVGVDFSKNAVSLCQEHYRVKGLSFIPGDAEALPFRENAFDVVLNVESSHCYASMGQFLSQVNRVLKPGGYFLFADFRVKMRFDELTHLLDRSGFQSLRYKDISANVLKALDEDEKYRNHLIDKGAPSWLRKLMREFSGTKGTTFYKRLLSGEVIYHSHILQKPVFA
jgi:ubiquinone/menaquinone biosynthesis C-methylase UbiE